MRKGHRRNQNSATVARARLVRVTRPINVPSREKVIGESGGVNVSEEHIRSPIPKKRK